MSSVFNRTHAGFCLNETEPHVLGMNFTIHCPSAYSVLDALRKGLVHDMFDLSAVLSDKEL